MDVKKKDPQTKSRRSSAGSFCIYGEADRNMKKQGINICEKFGKMITKFNNFVKMTLDLSEG